MSYTLTQTVTYTPPVFVERRWRWSWLLWQWTPQTLIEDFAFVEGGVLEGIEPWDDLIGRHYK